MANRPSRTLWKAICETEREHCRLFDLQRDPEERRDQSQAEPQVLADRLVLELLEAIGQPQQPQQHAAALFGRRGDIVRLGQDLEHAVTQADDAAELRQLHLAMAHLAKAPPLLADLSQPLGFGRREAPARAIRRHRNRLMFQRGENATRSHAQRP